VAEVDVSEFLSQKRCSIANLSLSDEQRTKLNVALSYPQSEIPNIKIQQVLQDWGFIAKKTSLSEHRRGVCCCD